jgi:short-subunit dehydrogenase
MSATARRRTAVLVLARNAIRERASGPASLAGRVERVDGARMKKTALVTGASAGLGAELASLLARDGHDLVVVARRRDKLDALAADIKAKHTVEVHVIAEDLAKPGAADRIVRELERRGIEIEVLVNNAGFGWTGAFAESDPARQLEMIQLNVVALVELTRRLLPAMIARKSGRVLNMGSTAGFVPGAFMAVYYASKAFVNSFTEALAVELEGTGVSATVSCPGATATEFAQVAGNDKTALFKSRVMTAREVAEDAYAAMMRGEPLRVAGFVNKVRIAMLRVAPRGAVRSIAANLNKSS